MTKKTAFFSISLLYLLFSASLLHALSWSENNPDDLNPGETVILLITGDCPPYTWEINGEGFSLGTPYTQEESNTLISDEYICGSAIITVADSCGEIITGSARGGDGAWVTEVDVMCGELLNPPPHIYLGCMKCSEVFSGAYRFKDCWFGGSRYGERYRGPNCPKWPETVDIPNLPYPENTCRDHGSPVLWNVKGLMQHRKLRWQCPEIKLPKGLDGNDCKNRMGGD